MLSGQNIGNALWGLRNMTSDHAEVSDALATLASKIRASSFRMNGQNIGNAFYSLHSMDNCYEEVKEVLVALAHKIVFTSQPLMALDIATTL